MQQLTFGWDPKSPCSITPTQIAESINQGKFCPIPILCTQRNRTESSLVMTNKNENWKLRNLPNDV
jgi:hypothetical protein